MELKQINDRAKAMMANFINELGLDGDYYVGVSKTPVTWGKSIVPGQYVSPNSQKLNDIIRKRNYTEEIKQLLNTTGLVIVNSEYKNKKADEDLYVTLLHETFHAKRNLLVHDVFRDGQNELAYISNGERIEQNTSEYSTGYADASQDIFKGNIDNSGNTIDKYKDVSSEYIEDMTFADEKVPAQMEKQQIIDEALVELMAILSYKLYTAKEKQEPIDIWNAIKDVRDGYDSDDVVAMCNIVLKHQDFELFKWMVDPITYSQGDIHYDFFGDYTKNDQEILQEIDGFEDMGIEDIFASELRGSVKTDEERANDSNSDATRRPKEEIYLDKEKY